MLLAVAQSRSLHVVHETYLCKGPFKKFNDSQKWKVTTIFQGLNQLLKNTAENAESGRGWQPYSVHKALLTIL